MTMNHTSGPWQAPSPEISAFFRELQKKGVATKLKTTTKAQRRKHAIAMNDARWEAKRISKTNKQPKPNP